MRLGTRRSSAQRLSASSEDSPCASATQCINAWCSTPFGIIGRLTLGVVVNYKDPLVVLNAFRHHRKTHRQLGVESSIALVRCSTPFGIIGRLTRWFSGYGVSSCCV